VLAVKGKTGDVYRVISAHGETQVNLYQWSACGGPRRNGEGNDHLMSAGDLVIRIRKYKNELYVFHPDFGYGWAEEDTVEFAQEQ
jgi:hypothetical protein